MKYIAAQPNNIFYVWQVKTLIHSILKQGVEQKDIIILTTKGVYFEALNGKFPEVRFMFYDEPNLVYKPAIKPYLMHHYFLGCGCRKDEQYFYLDADVILLDKMPDFNKETVFCADTVGYIGYDYIMQKGEDVLDLMCVIVKIDKRIIKANKTVSGGAQFVFTGTDEYFWYRVYKNSIALYEALSDYNTKNAEKYKGTYPIQKWTAEMWATLWEFFREGKNVQLHKDLDFAWPTDEIEKLNRVKLLHNAGAKGDMDRFFLKHKWRNRIPPFYLDINPDYCTSRYYNEVVEANK